MPEHMYTQQQGPHLGPPPGKLMHGSCSPATPLPAPQQLSLPFCGLQDATELVAKLRAYHYTAQTKPDKAAYQHYGLDLEKAAVRDNVEAGVLEAALSKVKIIQVG